jgi:hypothetical protein
MSTGDTFRTGRRNMTAIAEYLPADYFLIGTTLLVAIVGTLWKEPPLPAKIALIFLAVLSSAGSVAKTLEDNAEKRFVQSALIASLNPANASYHNFFRDLEKPASEFGYDGEFVCHHTPEGMSCFLSSADNSKRAAIKT